MENEVIDTLLHFWVFGVIASEIYAHTHSSLFLFDSLS